VAAHDPAREAALAALLRVERGHEVQTALDQALERVPAARDRALATELVYGVTRLQGALDAELEPLLRRRLGDLDPPVRAILRLGLYQLRHLDRIPAYAVVDSAVELAGRRVRAAQGLVNAVLRRAAASPAPDVEPWATHPAWLVRRWLERLGPEETRALVAADDARPSVTLRANRIRTDGEGLRRALAAEGIAAEPGRWLPEAVRLPHGVAPRSLRLLREGACTVQGEASMLVAHVADPAPGSLCLEVAAAPGGKATHLAEWMGDQGRVVANDRSGARALRIAQAAHRLGLRSVEVRVGDARELPRDWANACDVVVADLPCSGLGSLAARPDARWRKREEDIPVLAALQAELLEAAGRCVRPGGRLVYSTCTTEPEETVDVADRFLAAHPEFEPEDMRPRLPEGLRGETGAGGATLQLWPHRHGTEGFFIAAFRRRR
jgi:16S rRNA (cytosine967-C5)-methyltransferase